MEHLKLAMIEDLKKMVKKGMLLPTKNGARASYKNESSEVKGKYLDFKRIVLIDANNEQPVAGWVTSDTLICMFCGRSFGPFRWRHHCRHCGALVCDRCSCRKAALSDNDTVMVRICNRCSLLHKTNKHDTIVFEQINHPHTSIPHAVTEALQEPVKSLEDPLQDHLSEKNGSEARTTDDSAEF